MPLQEIGADISIQRSGDVPQELQGAVFPCSAVTIHHQELAQIGRMPGVRAVGQAVLMRVTVASLEKMGLVSGEQDPTDGRQTLISLTVACRETLKCNRAAREDWLVRALEAQLTPREQDQLAVAVKLLNRLADF